MLVVEAGGPDTIVVSGSWPSTSQLHSSGVVSTIAVRAHRADLEHVLAVGEARSASYGFAQATNGPRSSAHSKVEPVTVEEKTKVRGRCR